MKSSRGVTTTSLIIYVIAMFIVIGIIASITSFFYTNVLNLDDSASKSEITKFNMYFLDEVKNDNNAIIKCDANSVRFSSGNTFSFQDKCIYLNNIRICENIKNTQFETEEKNDKTIIKVLFTIGGEIEYTKTNKYVLSK